jgi:hypothetical protein
MKSLRIFSGAFVKEVSELTMLIENSHEVLGN